MARELTAWESKRKEHLYLEAAERGDVETFRRFQEHVHINRCYTLYRNDTALHLAARHGHANIVTEIFQNEGHGNACKNLRSRWGCTALHEAAKNGHVHVARILLDNDVDFNTATNKGHTALHEAVKNGHRDIVRTLLEKDVDLNAVTHRTRSTALHKAAKKGFADIARLLVEKGADVNISDKDGRIPLHNACDVKAYECLKSLLDGENVFLDVHDKDGLTPLHLASLRGFKQNCEVLVNKLEQLNNADDINSQCRTGCTALHYAVRSRNVEIVRLLLQSNADRTLMDSKGLLPIDYARTPVQHHIIRVLENAPVMPPAE